MFHVMASAADQVESSRRAPRPHRPGLRRARVLDPRLRPAVLAATHPTAARAIVEYRIRRLPAAAVRRRRAATPASAPVGVGLDGSDVTPKSAPTGTVGSCPSTRGARRSNHRRRRPGRVAALLVNRSWHLLGGGADRCCSRPPATGRAGFASTTLAAAYRPRHRARRVPRGRERRRLTNRMGSGTSSAPPSSCCAAAMRRTPPRPLAGVTSPTSSCPATTGGPVRHVQFDGYDRLEPLRVEGLTKPRRWCSARLASPRRRS